jgi:hypothetical protein
MPFFRKSAMADDWKSVRLSCRLTGQPLLATPHRASPLSGAAARATLGLGLSPTDLKTSNWDQLFDQDQKNAARA